MFRLKTRAFRTAGATGLVLCVACFGSGKDISDHYPDDEPPPDDPGPGFFRDDSVTRIDIELSPESLTALSLNPRSYVPGDLRAFGNWYPSIGVRLKGNYSFAPITGKAAFKLKFNEYDSDRRVLDLEGLTLNNLRQDRSAVHEFITYRVFRAAGAVAPRSGFAEVYVNRVFYGLYAAVESIDDAFLYENFGDATGSLYEGDFGDDLIAEDLWEFEQDGGQDRSRQDLAQFIEAVETLGDALFTDPASPLDTDAFLAFVASEAITGHWDGYWKSHNYRIYRNPLSSKWYFIPWGTDQSLERKLDPFSAKGLLSEMCFATEECRIRYAEIGAEVTEAFETLDLMTVMASTTDLVRDSLERDQRKPFEMDTINRHQLNLADYIDAQTTRMSARFDCTAQGVEIDGDDDGYAACTADCDDTSDQAHPGGTEVCDGLDNDCNGFVDDNAECTCPPANIRGTQFLLCDRDFTWTRARAHCQQLGARLAVIEDSETNDALHQATQAVRRGFWYHGLSDRAEEGTFRWVDGELPEYAPWAVGEKDDWGNEDCAGFAANAAGLWGDERCELAYPFVCEVSD